MTRIVIAWKAALCLVAVATLLTLASRPASAAPKKRLLVVTVTKGFRHDVIPTAEIVLKQMGESSGEYTVDYVRTDAEMAEKMSPAGLRNYDAVVFANTTGDLPIPDRDAFIKWIADGHGFIGIHAAADTFHGFPTYLQMLGAEFKTHGPQVEVTARVEDRTHPATRFLGGQRTVFDEIYQFQKFDRGRVHGLLTLDAHPNDRTPGDYPVAWCREEGKGRIFYTSLGHRKDVWESKWYQVHLLGGISWALGLEKGDAKPTTRTSQLSLQTTRTTP